MIGIVGGIVPARGHHGAGSGGTETGTGIETVTETEDERGTETAVGTVSARPGTVETEV